MDQDRRAGVRDPLVLPLDDPAAGIALVGGKGASLARLAAAGMPVPGGFHVTTAAYRRFVRGDGLQEEILAAASTVSAADPVTFEAAARRIGEGFAVRAVPPEVAGAIRTAYAGLDGGGLAVAVRSSATAEDLPNLSFAGQQDSFLNVRGDAALLDAVKRCWASLWTARAIGYRARHGIAPKDVAMAVVVQRLVPADAAGVLFTADPATGARGRAVINAAWGLGDAVVGGRVTPDTVVVDRSTGAVAEQRVGDKATMTVLAAAGTRDEPVPADRRRMAVLSHEQAAALARVGGAVEDLYGTPMDVEWAMRDGRLYLVQARPVTGVRGPDRQAEEWNDSLAGDYLWSSGNLGEAIPDVMTPCTWSLVRIFMSEAMATASLPGYLAYGNIGGRFYMNLSVAMSLSSAFGLNPRVFRRLSEETFGRIPEGVEIPPVRLSRWRVLRRLAPVAVRVVRRVRAHKRRLPAFVAASPARAEDLRTRVSRAATPAELLRLWDAEASPYFHEACQMLEAAARQGGATLVTTRIRVRRLMGEADAGAMFTGLHGGANQLASLGPLVGLARLARGELDRATFGRRYGHRGAHEFEVSTPRPAEDPGWADEQLAGLRDADDVGELLARQERARAAAWARFVARHPRRAPRVRRRLDRWAAAERDREDARSEVIRAFWVLRTFVLRAGELTGAGSALFFLTVEEILALLGGDLAALGSVPARRAAYERYSALPPYPTLIRGRFDPVAWAADPHRRSDIYAERGATAPVRATVAGFPGASGVVEGTVRVLASVDQGAALRPGEILVTTVTNIGWSPLFPRAGAIVTDVGAPLSHAAILARELGIPAVVGCGNATMRLRTGDRVRVDGARGTVEILEAAASAS
jgi:pyruvate,water dikinase